MLANLGRVVFPATRRLLDAAADAAIVAEIRLRRRAAPGSPPPGALEAAGR